MSQVPMFFRDCWWDDGGWWNGPLRSSRLLDQHFGRGLLNQEMFRAVAGCHPQELRRLGFSRPWGDLGHRQRQLHQLSATTSADREKFQINVDVQQFLPDEITVKTVDNCVVVEGKHDEKQDEHGFVTRHFVRRYVLPDDHDPKDVFSSLSSDGVLTITAPKKALPPPPPPAPAANERVVPITKTEENAK